MAYIREYWNNKEDRAIKAQNHTKMMYDKYKNGIEYSIFNTKIYHTDFKKNLNRNSVNTKFVVDDCDSVSAILKYINSKTAVLNFSSYKNAGGMFMNGSKAQEECLCHESFLYNVLSSFTDKFYSQNCQHKNRSLYFNRGLYSPDVYFERGNSKTKCDVITCASPNKSAAQKYCNVTNEENSKVLKDRIRYILDIANDNNVDVLILGAYGCGVFGQDATEVATLFKQYLTTEYQCFDQVVFAVPKGKDNNYNKFNAIFNNMK